MKYKVKDPKVGKALEELTKGFAVVYLDFMDGVPVPTAGAGTHKHQTYYLDGIGPHAIPNDSDATITSV